MAKRKFTWQKKYELIEENIGEGGNATVLLVNSLETGNCCALKLLREYSKEKEARFRDEITIMASNYKEVDGIMPIYDWSEDELWYVMPVAKPIIEHIRENELDFNQILSLCIAYAKELSKIHSIDIVHRDIKPLNLYLLNGNCVFGDFGLADFPESENDFTRSDRGLGAIFTIAPEMKRNPKGADGKKADVFSFAKTIWMFFSLDEKGFDGPYVEDDPEFSLSYFDKYKEVHLVELENLLKDATNTNPENRPSMEEFCDRLIDYQEILNDLNRSQESDWYYLSQALFGKYCPKSVKWDNMESIIEVLNLVGKRPVYNHMLFSGMGGLDFHFAEQANEKNWMYIYDTSGYCHLVKPKCLYYEDFGENFTWNYFLLELENAEAIEYVSDILEYELLVEDYPGSYVSARYHQYGVYDYDTGEKLPKGYKVVHRYLRGKLLIVFKRGPYNSITATYDGRHGRFTNEEFRKYIEKMIECEQYAISNKLDPKRLLNKAFHKNPLEPVEKEVTEYIKKAISKSSDIKEFIETHISEWRIELPVYEVVEEEYVSFLFSITTDPNSIFSIFDKKWILTKEGLCKKDDINENSVYYISSRKEAIKFKDELEQFITQRIVEAGLVKSEYCSYVSIEMRMKRKPTHLFTYDEMIEKMRTADDRFDNTIVIDGNGEIHVIRDLCYSNLYPVCSSESWNAGNKYVGKYANLDDETELYMNLLKKWYEYVSTGKHCSFDYYENISQTEEELIALVKENMD